MCDYRSAFISKVLAYLSIPSVLYLSKRWADGLGQSTEWKKAKHILKVAKVIGKRKVWGGGWGSEVGRLDLPYFLVSVDVAQVWSTYFVFYYFVFSTFLFCIIILFCQKSLV